MKYPDLWTVWVLREKPCLVGTAYSESEAEDLGNTRVSTKDFVIKKFTLSDWEPSETEAPVIEEHPPIDFSQLPTPGGLLD